MVSNSIRYLTIFFSYTGWLKLLNISKQIDIDVHLFNFVWNYMYTQEIKKLFDFARNSGPTNFKDFISWNTLKLKQNAVKIWISASCQMF